MSVDKQLEILKYQIKLMRTVVASDEHPFYMFLLDHDFTEEQTQSLNDLLYLLNHRLRNKSSNDDAQSSAFYSEKINEFKIRNSQFSDSNNTLFSDSHPTYAEFVEHIESIVPEDVNPIYLLKSLRNQGIYTELCNLLISQK